MCAHGNTKMVILNKSRASGTNEVPVDSCIADEVQSLNDYGVITYGCCCGHGKTDPTCLVRGDFIMMLHFLGYETREYSPMHTEQNIFEIQLKTGGQS